MSNSILTKVWQAGGLKGTAKLVLARLADRADDTGGSIYPSVQTIAEDCGLSVRAVQETLRQLETMALIAVAKEAVHSAGLPRHYRIDLDTLDALKRPEKSRAKARKEHAKPGADGAPGAGNAPSPRSICTTPVQDMHHPGADGAPKTSVYPSENPPEESSATATGVDAGHAQAHEKAPTSKQTIVQHVRDLITGGHSYRETAKLLGLGTRHDLIGDLVGSSATGGRRWDDKHWATAANAIFPEPASSDQMDRFWSLYDAFQREVSYATQRIASALDIPTHKVATIGKGKGLLSKDEADRFIPKLELALARERRNPRPRKGNWQYALLQGK